METVKKQICPNYNPDVSIRQIDQLVFKPLDLVPLEVTKETFFSYLVESGWIAAIVLKEGNKQQMTNDEQIEAYHQILLLIYDKLEKIVNIYENDGLLQALSYCKIIAVIQSNKQNGVLKKLKDRLPTVYITSEMANDIDRNYDPEVDPYYHLSNPIKTYDTNPYI